MSKHQWTRLPATLGVGVLALLAVATSCSSTDDAQMPENVNLGTLPPVTAGASCQDPTGDISDLASDVAGTLTEPSGIDLVSVTADVTDTDLTITYTTAGPVAAVSNPVFLVSQGVSGQEPSFELRAKPTAAGGAWTLTLITWAKDGGGLAEAPPRTIATPVTVQDNTLSYTVALTDLPRIATLIWQFGATAQLPSNEYVIDDCNNMGDQTQPDGTAPSTSAGPTTTIPNAELGAELTHRSGAVITIYEVQKPPANLQPLTLPPDEGNEPAAVYVGACAGEQPTTVRAGSFGVQTSANEIWPFWDVPAPAAIPAFPASKVLEPGDCIKGWVTFQLPVADTVIEAFYSPDSDGSNYLTWNVPAAG